MNPRLISLPVVLVLGLTAFAAAATDPQQLIADDQKAIQTATENYHQAILYHGSASDDAQQAMNKLDAAKNKLTIDQQRAAQLQEIERTTPASGGATPAAAK
jgi:hypothetical protein